jgi:gluconokinase
MTSSHPVIAVMGVSGTGKSTVGVLLAERLGVPFEDGDDLHPPGNIAKMTAGIPLSDADRLPWLDAVGAWASAHTATGCVIACSALRRAYRDRLRAAAPALRFVHLSVDRDTLAARMAARIGHFMPVALLDSQLATLEPLQPDEPGVTLDASRPPGAVAEDALRAL